MSGGQEVAEPSPARDPTAFQTNVLVVSSEEPRYALAIERELEAFYGEEVSHGRPYPDLDDLVTRGLVRKSELDGRTTPYALTDEGVAAVGNRLCWIAERVLAGGEGRGEALRELF